MVTLAVLQQKLLVAFFTQFKRVKQALSAASGGVFWTDEYWEVAALR